MSDAQLIGCCVAMLAPWAAVLWVVVETWPGAEVDPTASITAYRESEDRLKSALDKAFPGSARLMATESERR